MSILIGGGTGFIGRNLVKHLVKSNYEVIIITRDPKQKNEIDWSKIESSGIPKGVKAVVNVSGKGVVDYPFEYLMKSYKKNVYESRVGTNRILSKAIREMENPPELFLSMSGVGYYPPSSTAVYDENGPNGTDWMGKLSRDWELASILPPSVPVRRAVIRSGVVLGADGGIMKKQSRIKFLPTIVFGSGKQFFPWIHLKDMVRLIQFVIENPHMKGEFNGVSPQSVISWDFALAWHNICKKINSGEEFDPLRMTPLEITSFFGEDASVLLLEGQNVVPKRTLKSGFTFDFQTLDTALKDIYDEKYR